MNPMNQNHLHHDEALIEAIDRLLESDQASRDPFLNRLVNLRPTADQEFQQDLESRLLAQLNAQQRFERKDTAMTTLSASLSRRAAQSISRAPLTWGAVLAFVIVILMGVIILNQNGSRIPSASLLIFDQTATPIPTELSPTATPVPAVLEASATPIQYCYGNYCPNLPEDYFMIGLPVRRDTVQGLEIGDRVDVLAYLDGEIRPVVEDILLVGTDSELVSFAAPSWKQQILAWLYNADEPYALRLHTGTAPEAGDQTLVEYSFITSEDFPADYVFDLIVYVPDDEGYRLVDLPFSIDHIPFTANEDTLYFWFKNLEVVSIDGRQITIQLPSADAANLNMLMALQFDLHFVPDAGD